jgi:hypothetical protein
MLKQFTHGRVCGKVAGEQFNQAVLTLNLLIHPIKALLMF